MPGSKAETEHFMERQKYYKKKEASKDERTNSTEKGKNALKMEVTMKYYCNPVNVPYAYQFKKDPRDKYELTVNREAADPSMVEYHGKYYLFASMTGSVWVSEDMAYWESCPLPENVPAYDYAPDVRVVGDWMYFTASGRGEACDFYRTKDPINGPYEKVEGVMDYWDPNLFADDDGRTYFYWGCANATPIWGVELDPETMHPVGEKKKLIFGDPYHIGYERFGENHCENPKSEEEIDRLFQEFLDSCGADADSIPESNKAMIRATFAGMPYIEGAWMTKYNGKYYLQYACPGAELNVYADGVYVSDKPLGPFQLAENNPFSYKPGGFLPGAGHGSTMEDKNGSWWHTATMRISKNHVFERRVGIWPAGFDKEGNLFCNQRYGDWPLDVDKLRENPWAEPDWFLLSYQAKMTASGCEKGHEPSYAADEDVQTWWMADTAEAGSYLSMDLGSPAKVHAVQINFADDPSNQVECPGEFQKTPDMERYIDRNAGRTRWLLEGSADGTDWVILADKREAETDLSHDLVISEEGWNLRFLKLTVEEVPYHVRPSVSGFRAFGKAGGVPPAIPKCDVKRISGLDMEVTVKRADNVAGYQILWGSKQDQLYHSCMVMGECSHYRIGALVKGKDYYVRVDAFNGAGITHGEVGGLV